MQLFVDVDDADARQLAEQLPSTSSSDHGAPFAEIFSKVNGDFYKIDGALFSPAEAIVTSVRTGSTFRGGPARAEPCRRVVLLSISEKYAHRARR